MAPCWYSWYFESGILNLESWISSNFVVSTWLVVAWVYQRCVTREGRCLSYISITFSLLSSLSFFASFYFSVVDKQPQKRWYYDISIKKRLIKMKKELRMDWLSDSTPRWKKNDESISHIDCAQNNACGKNKHWNYCTTPMCVVQWRTVSSCHLFICALLCWLAVCLAQVQ